MTIYWSHLVYFAEFLKKCQRNYEIQGWPYQESGETSVRNQPVGVAFSLPRHEPETTEPTSGGLPAQAPDEGAWLCPYKEQPLQPLSWTWAGVGE